MTHAKVILPSVLLLVAELTWQSSDRRRIWLGYDPPIRRFRQRYNRLSDTTGSVAGCRECLELVAEDLGDDNEHWAHCLHCQQEISAQNGVEWRRMVRQPCPHCGKAAW